MWDLDTKAGKVEAGQVAVIWESPPFPDYQWTVRGDVEATYGAGFTDRLRAALRDNLRRRKAQARERDGSAPPDRGEGEQDGSDRRDDPGPPGGREG